MADGKRYKFAERSHARGGKWALGLGVASLALLAIVSVISAFTRGGAGIYVGVVGITAMLLSIYGFYVGMRSFREPDAQVLSPSLARLSPGLPPCSGLRFF